MTRTPMIETRVIEGFHQVPFARFASGYTSRSGAHDATMTSIGVTFDGIPAGLAVVRHAKGEKSASLESIFVDPSGRRKGIGRELIRAAGERLVGAGALKIVGSWYHDAPSAVSIELFLNAMGWSLKEAMATVHRGSRDLLEHLDRNSRALRLRPGFEMADWSTLTPEEHRHMTGLRETQDINVGLHPEGEPMLEVSARTSVVLRDRGEVAGWMLHHVLGPDLLRYSSLWIRPELGGKGLGIGLAIESSRRHLAVVDRIPRFFFLVEKGNDPMHRFIARRLAPAIDRSSTLMRSERSL